MENRDEQKLRTVATHEQRSLASNFQLLALYEMSTTDENAWLGVGGLRQGS